jgi:hypothetical protein
MPSSSLYRLSKLRQRADKVPREKKTSFINKKLKVTLLMCFGFYEKGLFST